VRLKLWDESGGRLVTFARAREVSASAAESTARSTSTAFASEGLIEQVGNAWPSAETPQFTDSLIDRILRLNLGELTDCSGSQDES
jgi:hypothetical protein